MPVRDFVAAYADMLTSTITIYSRSDAGDSIGGNSPTYGTVRHANVPASVQPFAGFRTELGSKFQGTVTHVAYVGAPITVADGDRFTDGTNTYRIDYWENEGGTGEAFAIYGTLDE